MEGPASPRPAFFCPYFGILVLGILPSCVIVVASREKRDFSD